MIGFCDSTLCTKKVCVPHGNAKPSFRGYVFGLFICCFRIIVCYIIVIRKTHNTVLRCN